MESNSGFAYVYNTNAIEIVTKGRIWPRHLTTATFFNGRNSARGRAGIKDFLFKAKSFQTRVNTWQGLWELSGSP